jgi:hypothetical protein
VEGGPGLEGLNDRIRKIAAANGVLVADTYGLLGPGDLVGDRLPASQRRRPSEDRRGVRAALAGTGAQAAA